METIKWIHVFIAIVSTYLELSSVIVDNQQHKLLVCFYLVRAKSEGY
jgi:hypothetical protein